MDLESLNLEDRLPAIIELAVKWGLATVGAIVALVVGFWLIKRITSKVEKRLVKREMDKALLRFVIGLVSVGLKVLLVLTVMDMVGAEVTSFIAVLGAAGLAVGMALSGTLQNFAGSVMILIFKPFREGELIEAQGHLGVVKEIQIFVTELLTPDNKTIYIPNGGLSNGSVINYSRQDNRRVDLTFGIAYDDDIDKARAIISATLEKNPLVLKEPAPTIAVSELGDSSVNFATRPWCATADYWNVFFSVNEEVKKAFDAEGITIPFPQRDIHTYKES